MLWAVYSTERRRHMRRRRWLLCLYMLSIYATCVLRRRFTSEVYRRRSSWRSHRLQIKHLASASRVYCSAHRLFRLDYDGGALILYTLPHPICSKLYIASMHDKLLALRSTSHTLTPHARIGALSTSLRPASFAVVNRPNEMLINIIYIIQINTNFTLGCSS